MRLSADFSAETLQARREWQDIFKVMKREKPTTQITLPSKAVIPIQRRNQKLYRQAEIKRIQQHQTRLATNSKGTYIASKHKAKERPTETNQK